MIDSPRMRAARFAEHGGPEVLRVEAIPIPEPGPGEVRVRVDVAALNHLDLWVRRGLPIEIAMPHIGGSDLAGRVDALGEGVATAGGLDGERVPLAEGDRVVIDPSLDWLDPTFDPATWGERSPADLRLIGEHTDGGFAEYAVVPAANVVPIPESLGSEVAAAASLTGVTAWRGLVTRGGLRAGETVLVTGASGGVSTMAIQIAKARGATVVAVTSTPWVERVEALGADLVLDRTAGGTGTADWATGARSATGGRGVDLVLDSVGAPMWAGITRALAPGGRVVSYGATGGARVEIDLRHHFWKQTSFLGSTMGSPSDYRAAMRAVAAGAVTPVIHARLPLDDIAEAHRMLEAGEVFGKVVVLPGSGR
ncbi:MAG: zinc-binding dehydrogenase [Longimicrobiales bacterium]|nr:zinc-binding dehydrogenase [Longimicrobiales bacterium]